MSSKYKNIRTYIVAVKPQVETYVVHVKTK